MTPKNKALKSYQTDENSYKTKSSPKNFYETHKVTGGKLTFPTKHHPKVKEFEAHQKEIKGRQENFTKFLLGKK